MDPARTYRNTKSWKTDQKNELNEVFQAQVEEDRLEAAEKHRDGTSNWSVAADRHKAYALWLAGIGELLQCGTKITKSPSSNFTPSLFIILVLARPVLARFFQINTAVVTATISLTYSRVSKTFSKTCRNAKRRSYNN